MPKHSCYECASPGTCYFLGNYHGLNYYVFICINGHRQENAYAHCPFCGRQKESHLTPPAEAKVQLSFGR